MKLNIIKEATQSQLIKSEIYRIESELRNDKTHDDAGEPHPWYLRAVKRLKELKIELEKAELSEKDAQSNELTAAQKVLIRKHLSGLSADFESLADRFSRAVTYLRDKGEEDAANAIAGVATQLNKINALDAIKEAVEAFDSFDDND